MSRYVAWIVWCVDDGEPYYPLLNTAAESRSKAIANYDDRWSDGPDSTWSYKNRRRRGKVLAIRTRLELDV